MDYGLCADSLQTGSGLYTDSLQTDYDLFSTVYGLHLANIKNNIIIMRLTCPGFFCDGGHVGRSFVNPGLLVMVHNSSQLSEKMFL